MALVNSKGGVQKVIENVSKETPVPHRSGSTTLKLGIKEVDEEQISTAKRKGS